MPILALGEIFRCGGLLGRAELVRRGRIYCIDIDGLQDCHWTGEVGSSWFVVGMVGLAKSPLEGSLSRCEVLQLVAEVLGLKVDSLEETLDWNADYWAMRDGFSVEEMDLWLILEQGAHDEGAIPPSGTRSACLLG
jgi:hypothetical protein